MESEDIAYLHQQRQELIEEAKSQKQTAFSLRSSGAKRLCTS